MFRLGFVLLVVCIVCIQAKPTLRKSTCKAPNGISSPCYQLIKKTAKYEERKYASSLWVSTSQQVPAGVKLSSKISRPCYGRLRRYLASHNVSMGVPVLYTIKTIQGGKVDFTMSFYLPNNGPNTGFQAPAPHNTLVRLDRKPAMTVYVKVMKNLRPSERFSKALAQQLSSNLKADGLVGMYTTPDVLYMAGGYDAPWHAKRTNEFWLVKV